MKRSSVVPVVFLWAVAAAAASPPGGEKGLVLDENGYFRIHYEFGLMRISSQALKAEGDKLLGANGLKRLAKRTRGHLRDRKIDWKKTDWRDMAVVHFCRTQLGDDTRAVEMIKSVPPAADWAAVGFDDSAWMRQRIGRLPTSRYSMESYDFSSLLIRKAGLRTYFQVDDPVGTGELKLRLTFRGGARVLINGTEVARAYLPQGRLDNDTPAEPYPLQAYIVLPGEGPQPRGGCFADIRCEWEEAPPGTRRRKEWAGYRLNAMRHAINEAGWRRLKKLRDRRLDAVTIPAKLLRKGRNVLAIEIRAAHFHPKILRGAGGPRMENWTVGGGTDNNTWDHCRLLGLELRAPSGKVPSGLRRPAGVQAWAEDMHTRLFDRDFNPPGWPEGHVRFLAALNGTFSAQVGLGTDRKLSGLKVSVTPLERAPGEGSASIPASAVTVSYLKGYAITRLHELGHGRCLGLHHWNCPMAVGAVARYRVVLPPPPKPKGPPKDPRKAREAAARLHQARRAAWARMLSEFKFFDHITAEAPKTVPAGTCQPLWLTVKVPPDAKPGTYRGSVTIRADGVKPISLPVELEVVGWRVPDPLDFQSIVQSEQSPYGVHKAYAPPPPAKGKPAPRPLKLWSQRHWRLMDVSFRQLARLGADWIFVPVLMNSEFGNRDDCSMIKWVRRKDGSLHFDYAVLDRYLDMAKKHLGKPRVICFQIMHGVSSATNAVKVHDEATGKVAVVDVGPASVGKRRPLWRAFTTSLLAHMRRRGLVDRVYWGHAFDRVYDPGLIKLMAELAPGVHWAAGAHARKPDATFRAVARTYGSDMTDRSMMGWKNPFIHLVMPRSNGSTICVEGTSTPFTYRVMCDRAIYCGFNGVGRMGADYFNRAWFDGFRGGEYLLVGRSCVQTLWPGPAGAESSARNEAMLEGVQEAEARIFIEQALDRELLPAALAGEARNVLDDHFRSTLYVPGGTAALTMMEYTGDWQGRSRRLFATAARVAGAVGVDLDRTRIGGETLQAVFYGRVHTLAGRKGVPLPAGGKATVTVKLRNWTGKPRSWKASTTHPWIKPARAAGRLAGQEQLAVTLDGKGMTPGKTVTGILTITDLSAGAAGAAAGRRHELKIVAEVVKPVELIVKKTMFNVTVGESASQDYLLLNRSASARKWTIAASASWMKVAPASGALAPGESTFVKLTVAPSDKSAAVHETTLTLTASGGAASEPFAFRTFVIPPYRRPEGLPAGKSVPLATVSKDLLVRHVSTNWFRSNDTHKAPTFAGSMSLWHTDRPVIIAGKTYPVALWALPPHETVYNITGKGFTAFSAEVGWNGMVARDGSAGRGHNTFRLSFEVFIDGQIVTQSGLMKATDKARLLVAKIPPAARRIKLVTRATANFNLARRIGYANWALPKLYKK